MQQSLSASGDAQNVIILGAGSEESVERSQISAVVAGVVSSSLAGLASVGGQPAVSPEVYYNGEVAVTIVADAGSGFGSENARAAVTAQAILRGVTWQAFGVHQRVRLTAGIFLGPTRLSLAVKQRAGSTCQTQLWRWVQRLNSRGVPIASVAILWRRARCKKPKSDEPG